MSTVSKNVKKQRLACNYTQEYVAKCLDISVKTLGEIERGNARLYLALLESLAQVLNTDVSTLMGLPNGNADNTPPYLKQYVKKMLALPNEEQELILQLIEKLFEKQRVPAFDK